MSTPQLQPKVNISSVKAALKWLVSPKTIGHFIGRVVLVLGALITLGTVYVVTTNWLQSKRKYRILIPLSASSQEFLEYMKNGSYPQDKYASKVSKDIINAAEAAKSAWFKDRATKDIHSNLKTDSVDFYYFPEGYDDASYKEAFNMAIRKAAEEGFEVVGAIGHVTSSVTRAYGPYYAQQELPLLLPLATASDLTYYLKGTCKVPAVLRLVPANSKQVELITKFLKAQKAFRAIIAKDLSNTAYSDDLVEGLRNQFVPQPFEDAAKQQVGSNMYLVPHGRILAVVPSGGVNGEPIMYPSIKPLKADAFIIVGMTNFSLEALAQARDSNFSTTLTILTDGAVDEHLLPRVNGLLETNPSKEPPTHTPAAASEPKNAPAAAPESKIPQLNTIYMTFPLESPMPEKFGQMLETELGKTKRDLKMTHMIYVADAVQILLTTLNEDVVKGGYSLRDAKGLVAERINVWNSDEKDQKKKDRKIDGVSFSYDPKRQYMLDGYGNSIEIDYHLYRATLPGITIDDGKTDWGKSDWTHDTSICPVENPNAGRTPGSQ